MPFTPSQSAALVTLVTPLLTRFTPQTTLIFDAPKSCVQWNTTANLGCRQANLGLLEAGALRKELLDTRANCEQRVDAKLRLRHELKAVAASVAAARSDSESQCNETIARLTKAQVTYGLVHVPNPNP